MKKKKKIVCNIFMHIVEYIRCLHEADLAKLI